MKTIYLYTDGACSGNQHETNVGGYGAILQYGQNFKEIYGGDKNTTNNIMELLGVIESMKLITDKSVNIEVYSDSAYVVECFRKSWYVNWEKNGWKNSKKQPVENKALWVELLDLVRSFNQVTFFKVKGHLDVNKTAEVNKWYKKFITQRNINLEDYKYLIKMNNRADELANIGMDENR
ncbi:ribonuclease HI [Acidaminobacter sp. JC074]|uniref:ribonuclease H family protein n=1 Tax=Acidaminobacter sp. JC074 TaxID=2530199 RepID=UPI001F0DC749|nr:ribonuclease HI [Acidaminobacter sp. JC074]MCH4887340.1 ribonuclease HI [Acidaminobacter sp. JC074]